MAQVGQNLFGSVAKIMIFEKSLRKTEKNFTYLFWL